MSWLSHVFAVPSIGLGLEPIPVAGVEHLGALTSFLAQPRPSSPKKVRLQFELPPSMPATLKLHGDGSGLTYAIEHEKAFVQFQHPNDVALLPGGGVSLISPTEGKTYDELMDLLRPEALEFFDQLLKLRTREVRRVGVVANVELAPDNLPAGVAEFLAQLPSPGGKRLSAEARVTVELSSSQDATERCIIRCRDDATLGPSVFVSLDWQREFAVPQKLSSTALAKRIDATIAAAAEYFQRFGEGGLEDDDASCT